MCQANKQKHVLSLAEHEKKGHKGHISFFPVMKRK